MKRTIKTLYAGGLILLMGMNAAAQIITTGEIVPGRTVTERSAVGGRIASVYVWEGSRVQAGDTVASIALTPVYAPCDGTVETVFADAGASAGEATEKYSGVLSLRPENRYTLYADSEYAYESVRTGRISAGQQVWLKCTADGSHRGVGRITNVDGEIFTIEALGGEFYTGETAYVYMEDDYQYADRIGKATVVATPAEYVSGDGDVVNLYVQPGDFVQKGQLLFETVGALSDEDANLPVTAGHTGYIISLSAETGGEISKDDPVMEICPEGDLLLAAQVPETEISSVRQGAGVVAGFELPEGHLRLKGTVAEISYLPTEGDVVSYEVRISLEPDARIAPGMTADITIEN